MKRIIILIAFLMLASLAWGQKKENIMIKITSDNKIHHNFGPQQILHIGNSFHPRYLDAKITIKHLLIFWDQYSKECYADSTQKTYNVYNYCGEELFTPISKWDIDLGINQAYRGTRKIWKHREPSFPDFMVWLKKKVGVK